MKEKTIAIILILLGAAIFIYVGITLTAWFWKGVF